MNFTDPDEPSPAFYVSLACTAISRKEYKDALLILKTGLEHSSRSREHYDGRDWVTWFYSVVKTLHLNLEEAYGGDWEEKIEIPRIPEEPPGSFGFRCSFCGKAQGEVAKLIAGPTVYICNECIEICNETIADSQANPGQA